MKTGYQGDAWCVKECFLRVSIFSLATVLLVGVFPVHAEDSDFDSDGILDNYETFFGLNPTDPADASIDCDSDTLSNAEESHAWSDPYADDTDLDGWMDGVDSNPVSRAVLDWGDLPFVGGDNLVYTWPPWLVRAWKEDGIWLTNPAAWHVAGTVDSGVGSLNVSLNRALLTNDLVLRLDLVDSAAASLYVNLVDPNGLCVVSNLFGNLLLGSMKESDLKMNLPLRIYPSAWGIQIARGYGDITVYNSVLYVDEDGDDLDAAQEAQIGTSDRNSDSDGDSMADDWEVLHGSNPCVNDSIPAGRESRRRSEMSTNRKHGRPKTIPREHYQSRQTHIYVDVMCGDDEFDGRSPVVDHMRAKGGPKKTIDAGINAAEPGDTIEISAGVYDEQIDLCRKNVNVVFRGKVVLH